MSKDFVSEAAVADGEIVVDREELLALRREVATLRELTLATIDPEASFRNRIILLVLMMAFLGLWLGMVFFILVDIVGVNRWGNEVRRRFRNETREALLASRGRWPF